MLVPFYRTLILYAFIILAVRLMGKRQVGEMQPAELVITILVSAVASVPMQDLNIPLAHGIVPILTLIGAEVLISTATLKNLKLRRLLSGSPVAIIEDGKFNQAEMKKLRLSLDDVLEDLRLKDVFDVRDIKVAYVETNGQLSVLLKSRAQPATAKMLSLSPNPQEPFYTIISDGHVLDVNLSQIGKTREWLDHVVAANGKKTPAEIFFLFADRTGTTIVAGKEH